MPSPPPDDLFQWPKKQLVREVGRLRALLREHADRPGSDPRGAATTGAMIGDTSDPHGHGTVLLDTRSAVLLDAVDVSLVDTKANQPLAMMFLLSGRVNYSTDRVEHAYVCGPDGGAAIVSEIMGLVSRAQHGDLAHGRDFAADFWADLVRRRDAMTEDGTL